MARHDGDGRDGSGATALAGSMALEAPAEGARGCRGEATGGAAAGAAVPADGRRPAGRGAGRGGWTRAHDYFAHVETDDAFVAGYTTAVGSRVSDVVEDVLVNDNDQVEKGTLLVRLDPEPFRVQVEMKQAELKSQSLLVQQMVKAVETDRAELANARLKVAAALAGLEEAWKAVEGRQEQVRYRVASLHAAAAAMRATQAEVVLAEKDHERIQNLVSRQSGTTAELDQRWATLVSAREKVKAAEQQVQQARAQLALPPDFKDPERVPADLERSDTEVRRAVAMGQQVLATLGVEFGRDLDPVAFQRLLQGLKARAPAGWIDRVPLVQAAQAKLESSLAALGGTEFDPAYPERHPSVMKVQKELDDAFLHLGYTEIRAPVSGFVNRRSVHPGDQVQAGQALLSIQPLDDVYVVANFKETQLADLRIGQSVAIHVDAYPGRPVRGRVSGFAPATGTASSLLPPENATGNYVKVVQRHPGADRPGRAEPDRHAPVRGDVGDPGGGHQDPARRPGRRRTRLCSPTRTAWRGPRGPPMSQGSGEASYSPPLQHLADRGHGHAGHLHGGARHLDRQRGPAPHRRQPLGVERGEHLGPHQLPGRQRRHPAALRLALGLHGPEAVLPDVGRAASPSARPSAAWPRACEQLSSSASFRGSEAAGLQPSEQAILMDTFPAEEAGHGHGRLRHGGARAPVLGPTLGG